MYPPPGLPAPLEHARVVEVHALGPADELGLLLPRVSGRVVGGVNVHPAAVDEHLVPLVVRGGVDAHPGGIFIFNFKESQITFNRGTYGLNSRPIPHREVGF